MDAGTGLSSAADRVAAWAAALLLALIAGFYLVRGMPWPYVDDVPFAGAGIDLARTGQMTNHTMDAWLSALGTQKFYIQLPFQTYSLAAWIHLFGVGTKTFIAFQWLWYVVGGFGMVRVLGRFGLPLGVRFFLVTVYLTLMVQLGFRPEPEAFGLMFAGLALVNTAGSFGRKMAALLLLGCGLLTYPLTLAFAVPFVAALLWLERPAATPAQTWARETARAWVGPGVMAVGVVSVSFLAMIHLEVEAFWSMFNGNRTMRKLSEGTWRGFFRLVTAYHEALLTLPPLFLLVASVLFVARRGRQVELALRLWIGACVIAAAMCIVLYTAKAPGFVTLLAFCAGGGMACAQSFGRHRWTAVLAVTALWVWSQSLWIVNATWRRFPDPVV